MNSPTANRGRTLTLSASLVGLVVAAYLIKVHVQVAGGGSVLCDVNGVLSCSSAAASSYAKLAGIPIALLGASWFVVAAALTFIRRPGFLAIGYGLGTAYSLFLLGISAFVLQTLCVACVILYICNFVGLVGSKRWAIERSDAVMADARAPGAPGVAATAAVTFAALVAAGMAALPEPPPTAGAERLSPEQLALLNDAESPAKGAVEGPITIVEFSDFQCPFCSRLAGSLDELLEAYPDQVRLEFRHFPLSFHANAQIAAEAAVCADQQGRFWELHDAMFANQGSLARDGLMVLAREAGVDVDALTACLDSGEAATRVAADQEAGRSLGVTGTPNFFVNGIGFAGALPYEELVNIVEAELAR